MNSLSSYLAPLVRRVRGMVSRGIISLVDDARRAQEVQVRLSEDELRGEVERIQQYGFSSRPHAGAEAIIIHVGGDHDHPIVIAVEDRRYRLTALESGEVALYDDLGQAVILRRDKIEVIAPHVEIAGNSRGVARINDEVSSHPMNSEEWAEWLNVVSSAVAGLTGNPEFTAPLGPIPGSVTSASDTVKTG